MVGVYQFHANHHSISSIPSRHIQDTNVVMVCYSIDNQSSFKNIGTKWMPELKQLCPNVPFILVALKTDLRNVSPKYVSRYPSSRGF